MQMRPLDRAEIATIWTIDRGEVIHNSYELREGALVLRRAYFEATGWPPGAAEHDRPWLEASFDRGGAALGMFDDGRLVGVAVVDPIRLGAERDQVQLLYLHVSRVERGRGIGAQLFEAARAVARAWGARFLYVPATPTENTVDFYLRRGCVVAATPDPELFAREPEDIHFVCSVERG
jgi:GNAT superfamily N-acetyltransferase